MTDQQTRIGGGQTRPDWLGPLRSLAFRSKSKTGASPLETVQQGLNGLPKMRHELKEALRTMLADEPWTREGDGGPAYEDFGEFAVAPLPYGLAATDAARFGSLHALLVSCGAHAYLGDVLVQVVRGDGRPRKTPAAGRSFVPFWPAPSGPNTVDYKILALRNEHAEIYQSLRRSEITWRDAVRLAGLNAPKEASSINRKAVMAWLAGRSERTYASILRQVFRDGPRTAQVALISQEIEPTLQGNLSRRWRENAKAQDGAGSRSQGPTDAMPAPNANST
jgi:hypothetical protein